VRGGVQCARVAVHLSLVFAIMWVRKQRAVPGVFLLGRSVLSHIM